MAPSRRVQRLKRVTVTTSRRYIFAIPPRLSSSLTSVIGDLDPEGRRMRKPPACPQATRVSGEGRRRAWASHAIELTPLPAHHQRQMKSRLSPSPSQHRRNHAFWLFLALRSSHLDHIISPRGPGRIHDQIPFLRSCPLLSSPVSPSPSRCRCSSGVVRGDQSRRLCHPNPSPSTLIITTFQVEEGISKTTATLVS